jgi:type II secretory pathway pseudopilin PulG
MRQRGLTAIEILLALLILGALAFLLMSGQFGPRHAVETRQAVVRSAYDHEAFARFALIRTQVAAYLPAHSGLFTWLDARDLDLSPAANWTFSLRRISALEVAVIAHGRTDNQGRRWRLSMRTDGTARTELEAR